MATLREAIAALQAHALAAGAKEAPTDPTEGVVSFPFSVCYPETGTITGEAQDQRRDISTVILDYHVDRSLLPESVQAALTFYEAFPKRVIHDPTLGSKVDTIQQMTWQFGGMKYNGIDTVGFRFRIPVKIRSATDS